jgi:hypothetical protein
VTDELGKKVELLEAVEEIKTLKASYCYLADAAYQNPSKWNELTDHFCDDGWVDFGEHGRFEGKEAVRRFFTQTAHNFVSYAAHMVSNPIITVAGTTAHGSWYLHCPCTDRSTGAALWINGRYEDEFVRQDGKWMWMSITFISRFAAPFDTGWAAVQPA